MSYLAELKWKDGYVCPKCGNKKYCGGHKEFDRQCTKCNYIESPNSGTLFHKTKFSILKAFYIVYYVSTNPKGISITELSRKLSLRQKTCWSFKQKVMRGMRSSNNFIITGNVEVDETVVGGQEEGVRGRKNRKKKLIVFAMERKGKSISRLYGKVINNSSAKELGKFMKEVIEPDAKVKTDGWHGYTPLKNELSHMYQVKSGKKGENFPDLHRIIMSFKGWLRGIHHNVNYLQRYVDEYCYRFNRRHMKDKIFDNLLLRMIKSEPFFQKFYLLNA